MGTIPPTEKEDFAPTFGSIRENLESNANSAITAVSTDTSSSQNQNLSSTDYRLQFSDFRFLISDFRFQITDYILQITDYRLQITNLRSLISKGVDNSSFQLLFGT